MSSTCCRTTDTINDAPLLEPSPDGELVGRGQRHEPQAVRSRRDRGSCVEVHRELEDGRVRRTVRVEVDRTAQVQTAQEHLAPETLHDRHETCAVALERDCAMKCQG